MWCDPGWMNAPAVGGGQVALLGTPIHKAGALHQNARKCVSSNYYSQKYYHILHMWRTCPPIKQSLQNAFPSLEKHFQLPFFAQLTFSSASLCILTFVEAIHPGPSWSL